MKRNLEERLRDLKMPLPPSLLPAALVDASRPRIVPLPGRQPRRGRLAGRVGLGMIAAALGVSVNLAAVQVWPAYRQVLAAAPVLGPTTKALLGDLGLAPPGPTGGPTPLAVSQLASGVRLTVVAGYADPIRTILVVKTTAPLVAFWDGPDQPTLTDQYGQTVTGLPGENANGDQVLLFPPLEAGRIASASHLVLALSIPALHAQWAKSAPMVHVAGYPSDTKGTFPAPVLFGHWRVSFDLRELGGATLPLPGAQTAAGTTVTITRLIKSGPFLDVSWTESGSAPAQANAHPNSYQLYNAVMGDYQLYSPSGLAVNIVTQNGILAATSDTATNEAVFALDGRGTYRFVFAVGSTISFAIAVP